MNRYVNLVVTAALAIATAAAPLAALADPIDGAWSAAPRISDPCADIEPGPASPEPPQSLEDPDEVEASAAHARWLEGIWTEP